MVAEEIPVAVACRVLAVSESGYYERLKRAPSERAVRHAWLIDLITEVHIDARGTYGARRVHAELTLGRGIVVGHGQVEHRDIDGIIEAGGFSITKLDRYYNAGEPKAFGAMYEGVAVPS